jgi:hypothetical protein
MTFSSAEMDSRESHQLNYIFHRPEMAPEVSFSLAPSHSDSFENQTILNALVGTLVKYDVSGRIEPYLASSWSKSKDGRRWEFALQDHLECEDGTPITASSYSEQSGPSDHSDHSGRSGLPAQFDYSGPFEYPQQTRNDSLEPEFFSSIQRTINSHNETVPMDLSCFDCDVRQLAPYSTQRSPKNDFFFC